MFLVDYIILTVVTAVSCIALYLSCQNMIKENEATQFANDPI